MVKFPLTPYFARESSAREKYWSNGDYALIWIAGEHVPGVQWP
jgi:hypothetical protein